MTTNSAMPIVEELIVLPSGQRLNVRRRGTIGLGERTDQHRATDEVPFLLVHGLSSNARLWDGVGARLSGAGRPVVALDQRGHGRSGTAIDGEYSYDAVVADLVALVEVLGWSDVVLVGQSWGGNVVIEAAARPNKAWRAVAAVDGGTIALSRRFDSADAAWAALKPPPLTGRPAEEIRRLIGDSVEGWPNGALDAQMGNFHLHDDGTVSPRLGLVAHRRIVEAMFGADPADAYPRVVVPTLLLPVGDPSAVGGDGWEAGKAAGVEEAVRLLPDARVRWFQGAHDIHLQDPDGVAEALLTLV